MSQRERAIAELGGALPATVPAARATETGPTETAPLSKRPGRRYELDVLRVLAICGVVAIHAMSAYVVDPHVHGKPTWWLATGIDLGSVWTVPVFVMISGALLLNPIAHSAGPAAFYRKRLLRILPAMALWSLVYLLVSHVILEHEHPTFSSIGTMFIFARFAGDFYFLWLIVGLYVVAPVIVSFIQNNQRRAAIFATVAMAWTMLVFLTPGVYQLLGNGDLPIWFVAWTMWWPYVGFFVAGWVLRDAKLNPGVAVLMAVLTCGLLAEVVWQWGVRPRYATLQTLLPTSYLILPVAMASVLLYTVGVSTLRRVTLPPAIARAVVRLSDAAFGVFLLHALVLELMRHLAPQLNRSFKGALLLYVATLAVSYTVSLLARKVPYLRAIF